MTRHVVVVGAGVIGLFCAVRLAQLGTRVTLIEAEKEDFSAHGPAASLAAAGMLAPLSDTWSDDIHATVSDKTLTLGLASFDLWRKFAADALWGDGVRFDGATAIAPDAAAAETLEHNAKARGRKIARLTVAQWRKHTGLDASVENAFFIEDEAIAAPDRVLSGLLMEARRFGVKAMFSREVEYVRTDPLHVRLFEGETVNADAVLLAPGPWGERLAAAAPALARVRAGKGHIVPVALTQELRATIHAPAFYLARRSEREVLLGSTMEFDRYDRSIDRERVKDLLRAVDECLPGLAHPHAEHRPWAGIRPVSPDGAPMIGPSGDVLVACGHSRNGWLLAPITAEIVCAYIYGEDIPPLWTAFHPDRFEKAAA